ncbi:sensor histidine kinase [Maricaulis sp. CAU 1757]
MSAPGPGQADADRAETLAAAVRHDLIAPLGQISVLSEFMLDHVAPDQRNDAEPLVRAVSGTADEVARKLSRLLDLLALDGPPPEIGRADIGALAMAVLADEFPEIEVRLEGPPAVLATDPEGLQLAIREIAANAARWGQADGACRLALSVETDDSEIRLWLEDSGQGVPEAFRESMFNLFRRLHAEEAGASAGAGLTIARQALARSGASLRCVAPKGGGCAMLITWSAASV